MSRKFLLIVLLCLLAGSVAGAQKNKKPPAKSPAKAAPKATPSGAPTTAPILGSSVTILTKGGDKLTGDLVDLSAFSVRIRSNNLESAVPFESIAAISFGSVNSPESKTSLQPASEIFARDLALTLTDFPAIGDP